MEITPDPVLGDLKLGSLMRTEELVVVAGLWLIYTLSQASEGSSLGWPLTSLGSLGVTRRPFPV